MPVLRRPCGAAIRYEEMGLARGAGNTYGQLGKSSKRSKVKKSRKMRAPTDAQ